MGQGGGGWVGKGGGHSVFMEEGMIVMFMVARGRAYDVEFVAHSF